MIHKGIFIIIIIILFAFLLTPQGQAKPRTIIGMKVGSVNGIGIELEQEFLFGFSVNLGGGIYLFPDGDLWIFSSLCPRVYLPTIPISYGKIKGIAPIGIRIFGELVGGWFTYPFQFIGTIWLEDYIAGLALGAELRYHQHIRVSLELGIGTTLEISYPWPIFGMSIGYIF